MKSASTPSLIGHLNGRRGRDTGRPIIAITAKAGEIAPLIEQHKCGMVVAPSNVDGLTQALVQLANDVQGPAAMCAGARTMPEARFTRRHAFERWRDVLDHIG